MERRSADGLHHAPEQSRTAGCGVSSESRMVADDAAVLGTRPGVKVSFRRRWLLRWLIVIGLCGGGSLWMLGHSRKSFDRRPGQVIADFALLDVRTGQLHHLSDHRGRVVAIVFTGTNCPVGDLYMPRLSYLSRVLETRDVDFLAINSNASDSIEDVAEHARRSEVTFPVLKDSGQSRGRPAPGGAYLRSAC